MRVTVGKRLTKDGVVELRKRKDGVTEELVPEKMAARIIALIDETMKG